MSLNVEKIKQKVKRATAIKPTDIKLMRKTNIDDGMGGHIEGKPDTVATFQAFLDDSHKSVWLDITKDSGTINRTRSIRLLAVCEGFEIKKGDYFEVKGLKYSVTYPGEIVEGIYNTDLEVIQ